MQKGYGQTHGSPEAAALRHHSTEGELCNTYQCEKVLYPRTAEVAKIEAEDPWVPCRHRYGRCSRAFSLVRLARRGARAQSNQEGSWRLSSLHASPLGLGSVP